MVTAKEVAGVLENAKRMGAGKYQASCPAHDDKNPSLSITDAPDKLLWCCHGGCSQEDVAAAIERKGIRLRPEINPAVAPCSKSLPQKIGGTPAPAHQTYDYKDETGEIRYRVIRKYKDGKKTFFQQRKEGGKFIPNMDGVERLPYNLPAIIDADSVVIVEGEKDVDNLTALGVPATCNTGGAGKWQPELNKWFEGKDVYIIPDNDEPGRKHAENIAKSLRKFADPKIVDLCHGMPPKADISDWITENNADAEMVWARLEESSSGLIEQSPLAWLDNFTVSREEAEMIADPEWIVEPIIIRGHLIVIAADPNAGKTTIFFHLAGDMVSDGYEVVYVNADISAGDAKSVIHEAEDAGITLLLPDMKVGMSMADVVDNLRQLNSSSFDLSKHVFIFDTLKKMTDVINKSQSKDLMKLLRSLTSKGATIIALGHTNKYRDSDGRPIFEGTGDIRADVDELIYLIPKKNDDGSMTVSTDPDKKRGDIKPVTFEIGADRDVILLDDYVDVGGEVKEAKQREKDGDYIESIVAAIKSKRHKQKEILDYCKAEWSISFRQTRKILKRYDGKIWQAQRGYENNTFYYSFVD